MTSERTVILGGGRRDLDRQGRSPPSSPLRADGRGGHRHLRPGLGSRPPSLRVGPIGIRSRRRFRATASSELADPSVIEGQKGEGLWYLYCTADPLNDQDRTAGGFNFRQIPMMSFRDLVPWTYVGEAFAGNRPAYATPTAGLWAPEVMYLPDTGLYRLLHRHGYNAPRRRQRHRCRHEPQSDRAVDAFADARRRTTWRRLLRTQFAPLGLRSGRPPDRARQLPVLRVVFRWDQRRVTQCRRSPHR